MKIHPAGYSTIFLCTIILVAINLAIYFLNNSLLSEIVLIASILLYLLIVRFFRHPTRAIVLDRKAVIAPCDGKVVQINETEEKEFIKAKCTQVSIFMSPWDVHLNWYPISGIVKVSRHVKGKFFAAFKPKASLLNERHYTLIYSLEGMPILMKQIAGAMARKIINYAKPGQTALQSKEVGFIKFGSRVELFLPLKYKVIVQPGHRIKGGQTKIAVY